MNRFHFIVNPIAGSGKGKRTFEWVSGRLSVRGIPFTYAFSEQPGHATSLAKEAIERGEKYIVAVGGDGTLKEVAAALYNTEAVLGLLPAGSGNDLCKTVGIPKEPEQALEILLGGNLRTMDACLANDTPFFNVAGMGFDVEVLIKTEQYKKKLNGMLPYALGILNALTHRRTMHLSYKVNGKTHVMDSCIFSVGNGKFIGGGMKALPEADLYDGLFDIGAVEQMPTLRFISLLPRFIKGTHITRPEVHYFRTSEIRIESTEEFVVQLDGELVEKTPVTFRLLPGALKILAPKAEG